MCQNQIAQKQGGHNYQLTKYTYGLNCYVRCAISIDSCVFYYFTAMFHDDDDVAKYTILLNCIFGVLYNEL